MQHATCSWTCCRNRGWSESWNTGRLLSFRRFRYMHIGSEVRWVGGRCRRVNDESRSVALEAVDENVHRFVGWEVVMWTKMKPQQHRRQRYIRWEMTLKTLHVVAWVPRADNRVSNRAHSSQLREFRLSRHAVVLLEVVTLLRHAAAFRYNPPPAAFWEVGAQLAERHLFRTLVVRTVDLSCFAAIDAVLLHFGERWNESAPVRAFHAQRVPDETFEGGERCLPPDLKERRYRWSAFRAPDINLAKWK